MVSELNDAFFFVRTLFAQELMRSLKLEASNALVPCVSQARIGFRFQVSVLLEFPSFCTYIYASTSYGKKLALAS
jgi:hypothetical protein